MTRFQKCILFDAGIFSLILFIFGCSGPVKSSKHNAASPGAIENAIEKICEKNCDTVESICETVSSDNQTPGIAISFNPTHTINEEYSVLSEYVELITWVRHERCLINDNVLTALSKMPNLDTICFIGCDINGDLSLLSENRKIETVSVCNSTISNLAVQHIETVSSIRNLYFSDTSLPQIAIKKFTKLLELRSISLVNTGVAKDDLKQLVHLKFLSDVDADCLSHEDRLWFTVHLEGLQQKFKKLRTYYDQHGDFGPYLDRNILFGEDD